VKLKVAVPFFLLLLFSAPAYCVDLVESYRIFIENKADGRIMTASDKGKTWQTQGKVIIPVSKVNQNGYTASEWVGVGEVAATAVNAIHIKSGNPKTIFSILPREFLKPIKNYNSYIKQSSSIYTDVKINNSIFGGGYSPCVGNRVLVNGFEMGGSYVPKTGDTLTIIVEQPKKYPEAIVFENKFQGKVRLRYADGSSRVVAFVFRPVSGVGRFAGTRYLNAGRIRANHAGVIDISTSVAGRVGGFQIIPTSHAESKEMRSSRYMSQWMVVGPINLFGKSLEGVAPLFRYYLKPQYNENDIFAKDWEKKFLGHFLVEAKINGKWQPMPIFAMHPAVDLPKEANIFLRNVEEIRILFPL